MDSTLAMISSIGMKFVVTVKLLPVRAAFQGKFTTTRSESNLGVGFFGACSSYNFAFSLSLSVVVT